MASRVEVCFIGESDFVNNEKDFILKDNPDNPDWEIDSTISLELTDSLMRWINGRRHYNTEALPRAG